MLFCLTLPVFAFVWTFRSSKRQNKLFFRQDALEELWNGNIELRVASMNLALCQPSASAPITWTAEDQMAALRQELLVSDPHILFLQEAPQSNFNPFGNLYVLLGSRPSHKGYILLLIHKDCEAFASVEEIPLDIPAVLATLHLPSTMMTKGDEQSNHAKRLPFSIVSLHIASVHLNPSARAFGKRRLQLEHLLQAASEQAAAASTDNAPRLLLLGGDTNLRDSSVPSREEQEQLQDAWWLDAWVQAGSETETQYTWDTVNHLDDYWSSPSRGYWNTYHGNDTNQMRQRYDRVYYHHYDARSSNEPALAINISSFGLMANWPLAGTRTLFLSDHFGIRATLVFNLSSGKYNSWLRLQRYTTVVL